jgi:hypothetical protein
MSFTLTHTPTQEESSMRSPLATLARRALPLAAAIATVLTAACGGGDDSSTGPTSTPGAKATVTVVNHATNGTVMFLRYHPCGTSGWSSDKLGSSILGQNEQVSFEVDPGCIDVRATPSEVGLGYLYFDGVQLAAGEARTLEITAFPAEQ